MLWFMGAMALAGPGELEIVPTVAVGCQQALPPAVAPGLTDAEPGPRRRFVSSPEAVKRWKRHARQVATVASGPVSSVRDVPVGGRGLDTVFRMTPGARQVHGEWLVGGVRPVVMIDGGRLMDPHVVRRPY